MPKYQIIKELEKGFCRVILFADNGQSEEQTYQNDPAILEAAAQHFDAEHKRVEARDEKAAEAAEGKMEAKTFDLVDVRENLDA